MLTPLRIKRSIQMNEELYTSSFFAGRVPRVLRELPSRRCFHRGRGKEKTSGISRGHSAVVINSLVGSSFPSKNISLKQPRVASSSFFPLCLLHALASTSLYSKRLRPRNRLPPPPPRAIPLTHGHPLFRFSLLTNSQGNGSEAHRPLCRSANMFVASISRANDN